MKALILALALAGCGATVVPHNPAHDFTPATTRATFPTGNWHTPSHFDPRPGQAHGWGK